MRILMLGTAGYHPTDRRQTSCILLPDAGLAFDAGTGFYRVAASLTVDQLDIFLSHAHLDHIVGLTFFFTLQHQHPLRRIAVHADDATLAAVREHLFASAIFPAPPPFEWRSLQPSTIALANGFTVQHFPLSHPGGSRGFRLTQGAKSVAIVTDTTASWQADYVEDICDVDLLIHECNFPSGFAEVASRTGHSCLADVAALARAANVKRLILTHLDPIVEIGEAELAEARGIFSEIEIGYDNMEIKL